jgi:hypothetical protein
VTATEAADMVAAEAAHVAVKGPQMPEMGRLLSAKFAFNDRKWNARRGLEQSNACSRSTAEY